MKTVLFACIHNAGRSQMAAAWFNALADRDKARARSPRARSRARASIRRSSTAMREVGIDLGHRAAEAHRRAGSDRVDPGHDGLRRGVPGRPGAPARRTGRSKTRRESRSNACARFVTTCAGESPNSFAKRAGRGRQRIRVPRPDGAEHRFRRAPIGLRSPRRTGSRPSNRGPAPMARDEEPPNRDSERTRGDPSLPNGGSSRTRRVPLLAERGRQRTRDDREAPKRDPQRLDRDPQRLDRDPQRLDRDPQRLDRDPQRLDRDRQRLDRDPQRLDRDRQRLDRDRQRLDRDRQRLDRDRQRLDRDRQRLDRDRQRLDRDPQRLDRDRQRTKRAQASPNRKRAPCFRALRRKSTPSLSISSPPARNRPSARECLL